MRRGLNFKGVSCQKDKRLWILCLSLVPSRCSRCFVNKKSPVCPCSRRLCLLFSLTSEMLTFGKGSLFSVSSLCTVTSAKLFLSLSPLKRTVHTYATHSPRIQRRLMRSPCFMNGFLRDGCIHLGDRATRPLPPPTLPPPPWWLLRNTVSLKTTARSCIPLHSHSSTGWAFLSENRRPSVKDGLLFNHFKFLLPLIYLSLLESQWKKGCFPFIHDIILKRILLYFSISSFKGCKWQNI